MQWLLRLSPAAGGDAAAGGAAAGSAGSRGRRLARAAASALLPACAQPAGGAEIPGAAAAAAAGGGGGASGSACAGGSVAAFSDGGGGDSLLASTLSPAGSPRSTSPSTAADLHPEVVQWVVSALSRKYEARPPPVAQLSRTALGSVVHAWEVANFALLEDPEHVRVRATTALRETEALLRAMAAENAIEKPRKACLMWLAGTLHELTVLVARRAAFARVGEGLPLLARWRLVREHWRALADFVHRWAEGAEAFAGGGGVGDDLRSAALGPCPVLRKVCERLRDASDSDVLVMAGFVARSDAAGGGAVSPVSDAEFAALVAAADARVAALRSVPREPPPPGADDAEGVVVDRVETLVALNFDRCRDLLTAALRCHGPVVVPENAYES